MANETQTFQQGVDTAKIDKAMQAVENLDRDVFTKLMLGKSSPGFLDYVFPSGKFHDTWDMFENLVQDQIKTRRKQQESPAMPQTTSQAFGTMPGPASAVPSMGAFSPSVLERPLEVGQRPGLQYPPEQFKALMDALPPNWQTPIPGSPAMFPDRPLQPVEQAALSGLRQAELGGKLSFPGSAIQPPSVVTERERVAAETAKPQKLDTELVDVDENGKLTRSLINKQTGEIVKAGLPGKPKPAPLVNVENKLGGGIAKEIGPLMTEARNSAEGALTTHDAVMRANTAIAQGLVTLGPTATIRNKINQVSQIMGVGGKNTDEQLVNTRNVMRSLAQFSLAARKQLKGQGQVSDFEGKLIVKAESGEIDDMTMPELRSFLTVTDRLAKRQYDNFDRNLKVMKTKPDLKELVPFYELPAWSTEPVPIAGVEQPSAGGWSIRPVK